MRVRVRVRVTSVRFVEHASEIDVTSADTHVLAVGCEVAGVLLLEVT